MPGLTEVLNALYGSYRLARLDTGGFSYFTLTEGGFWRSFAAILLVAPLYYLTSVSLDEITVTLSQSQPDIVPVAPNHMASLVALAVQWVAWPLAMIMVTRVLGATQHYARFITVYNWSTVFQMIILAAPHAIFMSGLLGAASVQVLIVVSIGFLLFYSWFIVRTALEVSALVATGIVVLDIALGLVISDLVSAVFS
jgi:hypothetical protein